MKWPSLISNNEKNMLLRRTPGNKIYYLAKTKHPWPKCEMKTVERAFEQKKKLRKKKKRFQRSS